MNKKIITTAVVFLLLGLGAGKFLYERPHNEKSHEAHTETAQRWTCSMHPQIDLPEPGQCPICGMDLIPKTEGGQDNPLRIKLTENAAALSDIQTITVGKISVDDSGQVVSYPGTIETDKETENVQTAHVGGRIEKLYYKSEGEYVKKGSLIAKIYSPELVTAQSEFLEAVRLKNSFPGLYKAARNKLKNWKLSEKQIQHIEAEKQVFTNIPVYAGYGGYIKEIYVGEGDYVKTGSPIFRLTGLSRVWAVVRVYEKDLPYLQKGMKIQFETQAYPGKTFTGTLNFISPEVDAQTRTVEVRADVANPEGLLKPGMLIEAKITKTKKGKPSVITVPETAVLWTGKRSVVYVKVHPSAPEFEIREVVIGNEHGDFYEILSGLNTGDEVVVNGAFVIDAAAQLQGKKSMMNKEVKSGKEPEKTGEMKCGAGKCGTGM
jgi:Cu(I)/Ag(I) efflux system membrane fusion protein